MVSRRKLFIEGWIVVLGVPALFLFVYLYPYLPFVTTHTTCAIKVMTGIDCPGCGITRALSMFTHGNIQQSIYYHPLGLILSISLIYFFARRVLMIALGKSLPTICSEKSKKIIGVSIGVALISTWIIRLFVTWSYS